VAERGIDGVRGGGGFQQPSNARRKVRRDKKQENENTTMLEIDLRVPLLGLTSGSIMLPYLLRYGGETN
jgi:hypothetical protein